MTTSANMRHTSHFHLIPQNLAVLWAICTLLAACDDAEQPKDERDAAVSDAGTAPSCTGRYERPLAALPWIGDGCFGTPEVLVGTCADSTVSEGGRSGNSDPICVASPQGRLYLVTLDHGEELSGGYRHGADYVFMSTLTAAEEKTCREMMAAIIERPEGDSGSPNFFEHTLTFCTRGT